MSAGNTTVAVATCGRPDELTRCLRALADQTVPPSEVLVVDQAPSGPARDAATSSTLPAVRYLEQERLGISASRNLGLRSASGAVLAVTDDDCAPDPLWLAALTAALERPPRPGAVTGPILPLGEPPLGTYAISLRESDEPVDYVGRVRPWDVGSGANFAAPVAILQEHGGWDERLGAGSGGQAAEDAELHYRLLTSGLTVRYEPAAVVRHGWQSRERRLATRWSYGYGIGAMCGLWLAAGDAFSMRALGGYAGMHVRPLLGGLKRGDRARIAEHARALASLAPGLVYGLRVARRPSSSTPAIP